jgi:hypothetical protein
MLGAWLGHAPFVVSEVLLVDVRTMRRWWQYGQIGFLGLCLSLLLALPGGGQTVRGSDAWKSVYQQLPELPPANQYISRETQQPDVSNTFAGRLISYHLYTKNRPAAVRLDWKLTIADYLNANEDIDPDSYPTQKRMQTHPLEGDRAIIEQLTRAQRDQLVQALITALSAPSR